MVSQPQLPKSGPLIALDPGSKRVGVAISDGLQITVRPLVTLSGAKLGSLIQGLEPLVAEYAPVGIVVGHPMLEDGRRGAQAQRAETLAHLIRQRWPALPAVLWDERWSSAAADEILKAGERRDRELGRDAVAAAVILRSYLDSRAR